MRDPGCLLKYQMAAGRGELDIAHALAADRRDLDAAAVAGLAL